MCAADSALHRWPELRDDLLTIGGTFSRRPGSRTARVAVQLADGRSGSVGESLSRVLFYRHAVPRPELQHEVRLTDGTLVAVTDFYWEAHRHVGEFDGKVKYTELLREGETPGDAVFREKRREDAVRGCQLGVTRWTYADLGSRLAPAFIHRLSADLERSRKLYARTERLNHRASRPTFCARHPGSNELPVTNREVYLWFRQAPQARRWMTSPAAKVWRPVGVRTRRRPSWSRASATPSTVTSPARRTRTGRPMVSQRWR